MQCEHCGQEIPPKLSMEACHDRARPRTLRARLGEVIEVSPQTLEALHVAVAADLYRDEAKPTPGPRTLRARLGDVSNG